MHNNKDEVCVQMKIVTLLIISALVAILTTGAWAQSASGVVVSGQVYYCWADPGWSGWGDLFPYSYHAESDPGDWLYSIQPPASPYYQGQIQLGTNVSHTGPRTTGAYDGYCFSALSAGVSEFDFNYFAVDQSQHPFPVDHWGSNLLRLELWQVQYRSSAWSFDKLLWSSNGPWSITPQHAHVSLTDPYGIGGYAFRLAIVPEPGSFACLALPLVGLCGWRVRAKRRAVESWIDYGGD